MEFARDSEYRAVYQPEIPPKQFQLSVTNFVTKENGFEIWIEFSFPRENGIVVGTHVAHLSLSGRLNLKESHGAILYLND